MSDPSGALAAVEAANRGVGTSVELGDAKGADVVRGGCITDSWHAWQGAGNWRVFECVSFLHHASVGPS